MMERPPTYALQQKNTAKSVKNCKSTLLNCSIHVTILMLFH